MKSLSIRILTVLLSSFMLFTYCDDQCTLSDPSKIDCGYMGINQQQCQAKQCCWKPTQLKNDVQIKGDVPWCFYPAGDNPCQDIDFKGTDGPGFDQSFYDKMYALYIANININGKGGVVASPDRSTPGGSYYYHWMRDGALSMRVYMEINNMDLSVIDTNMQAYVKWVKNVQSQVDPNGFDIRINPKFELPDGQVFVGGWCRPQTDGPGLRSATLLLYADALNKAGRTSDAMQVVPLIKYDIEWIFSNWMSDGCDLWEEVRSNDFYWGRSSFVYSLGLCSDVMQKLGDSSFASQCGTAQSTVKSSLDGHWNSQDSYMTESTNRPKDGAVLHSFSAFNVIPLTDDKVAKTIQYLSITFCAQYTINQQDNKAKIPGILIGRYPGDSYAGGNPWQLLTATLAKLFYQTSIETLNNGFKDEQDRNAWKELLNIATDDNVDMANAMNQAGDSVLNRLYKYVKDGDGHISEQIDKSSGVQKSAQDLTWSFANILSAMKTRSAAEQLIKNYQRIKVQ